MRDRWLPCRVPRAVPVLFWIASVSCDTLIADRIRVTSPVDMSMSSHSRSELSAIVHDAFVDCGARDQDLHAEDGGRIWWDPSKPPGLHVTIHRWGTGAEVALAQNLYGVRGPTRMYSCVRRAVRRRFERMFGKDSVRVRGL